MLLPVNHNSFPKELGWDLIEHFGASAESLSFLAFSISVSLNQFNMEFFHNPNKPVA